MSRQKGGFGGYRGRRTLTDILRLIAVVLTVLVILVLAGLFFGQKYIVQTDRGLQFQLPQALRPGKEEPDIGDISVVIQPSDSADKHLFYPRQLPHPAQDVQIVAVVHQQVGAGGGRQAVLAASARCV